MISPATPRLRAESASSVSVVWFRVPSPARHTIRNGPSKSARVLPVWSRATSSPPAPSTMTWSWCCERCDPLHVFGERRGAVSPLAPLRQLAPLGARAGIPSNTVVRPLRWRTVSMSPCPFSSPAWVGL